MTKKFREAFLDALDQSKWTMVRVSELSGVSEEQLKKLKQGKSQRTNVDDAVRVANAFGVTLDEFLDDQTATIRSEIVDLYNQLSPEERKILQDAARGRSAPAREASE